MGKIRVDDLAQMMGIANQDLIFKLRSIGVRVDEEHVHIDTDVLREILKGSKKLAPPREVILRDEEAQQTAPTTASPRRRAARRLTPGRGRPARRRTMIQKVEPRIKTIPSREKEEEEKEPAAEAPETRPAEVEKGAEAAPPLAKEAEVEDRGEKKAKRPRKAREEEPEEDLRTLRGSLEEIEEATEEAAKPTTSRRKRRAQAKQKAEAGELVRIREEEPGGPVTVTQGMTVREFAEKLGVKAKDLITALFQRGVVANINHQLEPELAVEIAEELGMEARHVTFEEEIQLQHEQELAVEAEETGTAARAPVVTIMGHVDHGKTTLLDTIRETRVTESEHGGITQHIGAYQVTANDRKIVFLDTPGHEAFTMMRARGAKATDIVVLVVAADDGVMPQTQEAIDHAQAAGVPIVVAINKIDKANSDPDRVKRELAEKGLAPEEWGGETVSVPVSAKTGEGISDLLEMILLNADLLELKATPDIPAQGVVLEARKEPGRGTVVTVLVQDGSLRVGGVFVSGATWGRVRSMSDDRGERIERADPSTPVEVTGFNDLPEAGDPFQVVEEESKARSIAEYRQSEQRKRGLAPSAAKLSLEEFFAGVEEGEVKELPVVIKADVQGSVEVLKDTLAKASTDQVRVEVIHSGVGAVTTNDVLLASASEAIIFGFNVRPERKASELAEKEHVEIRLHRVIYELADELRRAMTGLLEPTYREVITGRAEVREIFSVPKAGVIAGSHVVEGSIPRNAEVRVVRDGRVVHQGQLGSLRRFKDDVAEVRTGFDCGIRLERFQDLKPGDVIEAFVQEEVAPAL